MKIIRTLVVSLVLLGFCTTAQAATMMLPPTPFEIGLEALLDEVELEYGFELTIQSLIGFDAVAYGNYSVYARGILIESSSFDTHNFSTLRRMYPLMETVDPRYVTFCALIDIESATVLGERMPEFEKKYTRCGRILFPSTPTPAFEDEDSGYSAARSR